MRRVAFGSFMSVLFTCLMLVPSTEAVTEGPSANGSFQISMQNGESRVIEFDASVAGDGNTSGQITFRDSGITAIQPNEKVEDDSGVPFYARAACDCLIVTGVEAALSGTITESSHKNYIGRRILLVVQDGDSLTPPLRDKLTFGFYRTPGARWLATDAERPDEQGSAGGWLATDSERSDDLGTNLRKSDEVNCQSFPLASHSFIGAKLGKGKIQVLR